MTDTPQFDFSEALRRLRDGKRVRRVGWVDAIRWIALATPTFCDRIVMRKADSDIEPWLHKFDIDILATDWVVVPDATEKAE